MKLAVFDTETSGLPDQNSLSRIVEVGVQIMEWRGGHWHVGPCWDSLARPRKGQYRGPAFAVALEKAQLTVRQIDAAPPDWVVARDLEAWLLANDVSGSTSFNRSFDFHGVLLKNGTWLRRLDKVLFPAPCLMRATWALMDPNAKWPSLSEALTLFGLPFEGTPHTALGDAQSAASLVPLLFPEGPEAWPGSSEYDPDWSTWARGSHSSVTRAGRVRLPLHHQPFARFHPDDAEADTLFEACLGGVRRAHTRLGEPSGEMLVAYHEGTLSPQDHADLGLILALRPDLREEIKVRIEMIEEAKAKAAQGST